MLKLHTLGGLSVHASRGPLAGAAAQPRRLAILAFLARGGSRGANRGRVLAVLWPDASDDQGRRSLAQALYALRRDLGSDESIVGTQDLRLNGAVVWCDVMEFEAALARGDVSAAAAVYVGPFLDGFRLPSAPDFERWADDERSSLQHRYRGAVEQLARDAESRGAHGEAVQWWRRRVSDDPLSATAALSFMRSLVASGDRAEAIRHARLFEALVAEELDMPADREVIAFASSLRDSRPVAPARESTTSSIAVLPFAVLGRNSQVSQYAPWCDVLAEELIGSLLGVPGARVIARTASFANGPNPPLTWLRDELRVTHAVEGSMHVDRSGLRVNVRLIASGDGHIVWWDKFTVSTDDAGQSHEAIARRVTEQVRGLSRAVAS